VTLSPEEPESHVFYGLPVTLTMNESLSYPVILGSQDASLSLTTSQSGVLMGVAPALFEQSSAALVEAEVALRLTAEREAAAAEALASHPLLAALAEAGIENADHLARLVNQAEDGEAYRDELVGALATQRCRLFGVGAITPEEVAAQCALLSIDMIKAETARCKAQADKQFDPDNPPQRHPGRRTQRIDTVASLAEQAEASEERRPSRELFKEEAKVIAKTFRETAAGRRPSGETNTEE
jgi:hypothetical protein